MNACPCQSGKDYDACCGAVISGAQAAAGPEALMRSRYSAFVKGNVDYLKNSLHPDHRGDFDPIATRDLAVNSEWLGLTILKADDGNGGDKGTVEFIARFKVNGAAYAHHELGEFERLNGIWYYTDGKLIPSDSPQTNP